MRTAPTRYRIPLALLLLLVPACSDDDVDITSPRRTNILASETFTFDEPVTTQTRLVFRGINGSVEIRGVPASATVAVSGTKYVGSDSAADAEDHLDDLQIITEANDATVTVRTSQPTNWRQYLVDYVLEIPQGMAVVVGNTNGGVDVNQAHAAVDVDIENGSIDVVAVSGDVQLDLVNGDMRAQLTLAAGGTADLAAVNGGIDLQIPQATSATLEAVVTMGSIGVTNLVLTDDVRTPHVVRGTLGAGDGAIALEVNIGSIAVTGF